MSLLHDISEAAKKRFEKIPFPHRKDEYWRFSDYGAWGVDALFPHFQNHAPKGEENAKMRECEKEFCKPAPHSILLFDGQLMHADVPKGVEVLSMGQAAESHAENVKRFFFTAEGKFDTLQASRPDSGIYIRVEDGVEAELVLNAVSKMHVSIAGAVVELGEGSKLKLSRNSFTFGGSFSVFRTGFFCGRNSKLELSHIKNSEGSARSYEREDFWALEGAAVADALAQIGAAPSRHERNFELLGERVDIDTRAFISPKGDITHDLRTKQFHRRPSSHSNLAVRAAIGDSAKIAFTGLVRVEPEAQKTRAYQSCRSLMLSPKAKAQAAPVLEICANDVECSHGCTAAKPDKEVLFYMNQRGLSPAEARALLVQSFAESTFEKMSDSEKIMERINAL